MCVLGKTVAYLCLNMINFDEVDFSESRSEEVIISFFEAQCMTQLHLIFHF